MPEGFAQNRNLSWGLSPLSPDGPRNGQASANATHSRVFRPTLHSHFDSDSGPAVALALVAVPLSWSTSLFSCSCSLKPFSSCLCGGAVRPWATTGEAYVGVCPHACASRVCTASMCLHLCVHMCMLCTGCACVHVCVCVCVAWHVQMCARMHAHLRTEGPVPRNTGVRREG